MSEVDSRSATPTDAPVQMPSAEGAQSKGQIPSAYDLPLADIMPISPRLFRENRWQEYFERLRAEDPVHFNETDMAGRFWSLTRYDDIKRVDTDWQHFTSSKGITFGLSSGCRTARKVCSSSARSLHKTHPYTMFSAKTVAGAAAPGKPRQYGGAHQANARGRF